MSRLRGRTCSDGLYHCHSRWSWLPLRRTVQNCAKPLSLALRRPLGTFLQLHCQITKATGKPFLHRFSSVTGNFHKFPTFGRRLNSAKASRKAAQATAWRQKLFRLRRVGTIVGIPLLLYIGGLKLHESNVLYAYLLDQMLERYTAENGYEKPPSYVMYPLMMWASMLDSHNPDKMGRLWGKFVPLIDDKYSNETRQVGLACLLGMLGGDSSSLPPHVFYQKCLKKLQIMEDIADGMPAAKFLTLVYSACAVGSGSPEVMMMAMEVLLTLTQIPAEPEPSAVDVLFARSTAFLMKHKGGTRDKSEDEIKRLTGVTRELCKSLLIIYQDPAFCEMFMRENPPPTAEAGGSGGGVKPYIPDFPKIKKVMVKNKALDFAFSLMKAGEASNSPQLKSSAMMLLLNIVGRYPDFDELLLALGETEEERTNNKYTIVDSLMNVGSDHLMRGQNKEALTAFEEACKLLPSNPTLEYFRAQCLIELRHVDAAREALYKLRIVTYGMFGPKTCMPEALYELATLNLKYGTTKEDLEEAIDALEMLTDRSLLKYSQMKTLDLCDVTYKLQNAYERIGDYQSAHQRLANVLKAKFGNGSATHGHAQVQLQQAVDRCTDSALLFECGRMALLCADYEQCEDYLLRATELEPLDSHISYHLALCQLKMGDFEDASQNIDKVLAVRPKDANAMSLKLKATTALGKWQSALEFLDKSQSQLREASSTQPKAAAASLTNDAMFHYEKAVILEHLSRQSEALQQFDEAVNAWTERVRVAGSFSKYFAKRKAERKALQKIQLRLERKRDDYAEDVVSKLEADTLRLGLMA